MSLLRRGILNIPHCTSCLGKWGDDVAQQFSVAGAEKFPEATGTCKHQISTKSRSGGLFIESIDTDNAIPITWGSDEIRWFGVHQTSWASGIDPSGYWGANVTVEASILPAILFSADEFALILAYNPSQDETQITAIVIHLADSSTKAIYSTKISGKPTKAYLGVDGDGYLYSYVDDTIYQPKYVSGVNTGQPAKDTSNIVPLSTINPQVIETPWTGTAAGTVLTNADDLSITMKVDRGKNHKSFCGDLIDVTYDITPTSGCDWTFLSQGPLIDIDIAKPAKVTGVHNQTITYPDTATTNQGYSASSYHDLFTPNWSSTELRLMGLSVSNALDDKAYEIKILQTEKTKLRKDGITFGFYYDSSKNKTYVHCSNTGTVTTKKDDLEITGKITKMLYGILGDGTAYVIANNQYAKVTDAAVNTSKQYGYARCVLFSLSSIPANLPAVTLETRKTQFSATIPDMSSEGITKITDFCGNEVT